MMNSKNSKNSVCVPVHSNKISSIYLRHVWINCFKFGGQCRNILDSRFPMNILAYVGATQVPILVPISWIQYWPTPSSIQRGSREDRVDSVFETLVLCLSACGQIFSFSLFQPSLFIQYSTEECSTVQVFIWCLDTIA